MGNPNSFGGGDEIDGQVGMDEWVKNNEDQEISSRVEGNLHTISQAQSLELLDSFESQIKDAEGKLDELDQMRRSREFEMMRNAIAARRAELTPNNVTEAASEDISISNEDASVDVAETSNYGGIDDRTLADIATSPDVGEESRTAAMREAEAGNDEIIKSSSNEDVGSHNVGEPTDEVVEAKEDNSEEIAKLEKRLQEVAEARKQAKEAGDYQQEAFYNSQYADIVAEINELKNGNSEEAVEAKEDNSEEIEESVGMTNESAKKDNDREERVKRNKEVFENALHKINECTDLDKLASWRKNLEEGFAKLDPAVQEKTLERYKEIMRAIDDRMEAPELNLRKYRAWQTGQMMEYKGLSDKDREDFKKKIAKEEDFSGMNWDNDILINGFRTRERESDHDAKIDEDSSTENNTDSGEASEDGVNKVPFEEYYLAELEDKYVDELLSHPDYTMQGGIRDRYIRMFKELGDSFYALVAKLKDSNLDADAKKNKLDEYRSIISEKISDIREKYESEMRGLAGKINALGREVSFGIMNNSDDKNEASAARKGALEEFDSFFAEDESEAADDSNESKDSSDNLDDDKEDSDNFVKKVDVLLNPDSFYKSDKGLRALFTGSRSYYDAIETLESAYLEGKTFDEVSSILDTVLSERGEEGKSRVLRKRLKRRYETLGINEDGTLNSEKSEKVSWRKRAANAIRKALKMEVE